MTLNYDYVESILRTIKEDKACKASDYILRNDLNKIIKDAQLFALENNCCPGLDCPNWDDCVNKVVLGDYR